MRLWGGAVLAAMVGVMVAGTAKADPKDYRFEAVQPHVAVSSATKIAVRLVHVPTGKPVADVIVLPPKMEMPMPGMAPMATKVSPATADGNGIYSFTADLSMAGPWTLQLAAKVQGEAGTVTGSVPFTAAGGSHNH